MVRRSIRSKLLFGLALVLAMLGILAASSIYGLRSYHGIIKICENRAEELSFLTQLWSTTSRLLDPLPGPTEDGAARPGSQEFSDHALFRGRVSELEAALKDYWVKVRHNAEKGRVPDDLEQENATIGDIWHHLGQLRSRLDQLVGTSGGVDPRGDASVQVHVTALQSLVTRLPQYLEADLHKVLRHANHVYESTLWLTGASSTLVVLMLGILVRLLYVWVIRPVRRLHQGSRHVAAGDYAYRIELQTHDEMAELAAAFNHMTAGFQRVYQDLDRQVQERSRQLVRSERLAGIGFLAAGVAHEINNPLTSIAMASESLESRLADLLSGNGSAPAASQNDSLPPGGRGLGGGGQKPRNASPQSAAFRNGDAEVIRKYLRMIHEEAFRCKSITERLLDFSRMGDLERQPTDLVHLTEDIVEMIRHLGKYRGKEIVFQAAAPVLAPVNSQEIKQVVLNLVANALESMEGKGTLKVRVRATGNVAELVFADDGCGMTPEVLENIFEPFFTRRCSGQGTGLGLSISHRIVSQHGGEIEARSAGPGKGSTFTVRLPLALADSSKEPVHVQPAA